MSNPQTEPKQNKFFGIPKRLIIAATIGVGIWLVWTQLLYPTYSARYRLSVDVLTPNGVKTGSSVIEAHLEWQPTLGGITPSAKFSASGEGIFVDLGGGKNLVVTLTRDGKRGSGAGEGSLGAISLPTVLFSIAPHDRSRTPADIASAYSAASKEVDLKNLPLIVSFADVNDPKSVVKVDPLNLEAVFGTGYQMVRANIVMTDEDLTDSIERHLPWLEDLSGGYLSGKFASDGSYLGLHGGQFKAEGIDP